MGCLVLCCIISTLNFDQAQRAALTCGKFTRQMWRRNASELAHIFTQTLESCSEVA